MTPQLRPAATSLAEPRQRVVLLCWHAVLMLDAISSEGEEEVLGLRAEILGGLGFIDGWLTEVLGGYLGRDARSQEVLVGLLAGLGLDQRCNAVISLLKQSDEIDDYPFVGLLPPILNNRNILTHMALDIFESTDELLVFNGYRRGVWQSKQVRMDELRQTEAIIWHAGIDLNLLGQRKRKSRYKELLREIRSLAGPGSCERGEPLTPDQLANYVPSPVMPGIKSEVDAE